MRETVLTYRLHRIERSGSQQLMRLGRIGLLILTAWLICGLGCARPVVKNLSAAMAETLSKPASLLGRKDNEPQTWRPDLAIAPFVEFSGDEICIRNVRNCRYRTESDYDVRHYDLRFALGQVRTVDFLIVPFKETSLLAHTMFSFGLDDGRHFIISVEARLGVNETYSAAGGVVRKYQLIYLIGDERDLIMLRTAVRKVDVYLYPGRATPDQVQDLLVDMLKRVNKLQRSPEYYDTLTNNCTTNLVDHINKLRPGSIPADLRVLLPGHSDRLAYDLGLLEINGPFEYAREQAKINVLAELYADSPDFSAKIRRR